MKIVQVGLGQWGKNHYRILKEMGMIDAVCDTEFTDEEVTDSLEQGIPKYTSLTDMIFDIKPDVAIVTTPTSTHFHIAHKLLLSGIHTFIEKPFTQSANDGLQLIRLAEKNGLKLTCGYIERFNPVTQYIQKVTETPKLLEFHRTSKIPIHIKDVGIVMDTAVHDIDTACYLFGSRPIKILSTISNVQGENVEDEAVIVLVFNEGVATITVSWNTNVKSRTVHATYTDFIIRGDFVEKTVQKTNSDGSSTKYRFAEANPLRDELLSFFEAVNIDVSPVVTCSHANMITEVANQVLRQNE